MFADKTTVYQQVGKGQYITHERADFAKLPETGEMKSISYSDEGKAVVSAAGKNKHGKFSDSVLGLTGQG